MAATFTENPKQGFTGDLSEGEKLICARFRHVLDAALTGQISFREAMAVLWSDLSALREFRYDVEKAMASGKYDPATPKTAAPSRTHAGLSDVERAFLEDSAGLIDWVTRNGVSFSAVLLALGHDVSELARDDFNLEKTLGPGRWVMPKVSGWARRNVEPVGEPEEQA